MTPPATLASLSRHPLVPIPHDLSVSGALAVVRAHRVHHLPVIQGNALVGILCSCDLHSALPSASVTTIMRRAVIALDHDASVLDAVSTMNVHHVGSVVLMDAARACAIVDDGLVAVYLLRRAAQGGSRACREEGARQGQEGAEAGPQRGARRARA